MAKDSFVLKNKYYEQIQMLNKEQQSDLLNAIFQHEIYGDKQIELDSITQMLYSIIAQDLKENAEKYEKKCEQNKQDYEKKKIQKIQSTEKSENDIQKIQSYDNDNDCDNDCECESDNEGDCDMTNTTSTSKTSFVKELVEVYNNTCTNLSKVKTLTESRKKKANLFKKQFKDKSLETFKEVCNIANNNDFLCGEHSSRDHPNWKADFDWLINVSNAVKVLEGKYDKNELAEMSAGLRNLEIARRRFEQEEEMKRGVIIDVS